MDLALEDVKVIDLTYGVAGPHCTKLMADYGANVIKAESPRGGDLTRRVGPFPEDVPHQEKSGLFLHLNTNKKSITLDVETASAVEVLKELVSWADVLVECYRPGYLESLGLGYSDLEKINPSLVMTSITDFGQTGPYKDYKGSEIVAEAMGAIMYRHGQADHEPVKYHGHLGHFFAGNTALVPTIGALFHSRLTGTGQHVDVSIQEALLGAVDRSLLRYPYTGEVGSRDRASGGAMYPNGAFPCKDGFISILGGGTRRWPRVCRVMDRADLITDPRFKTPEDRAEHVQELDAIWRGWLLENTMNDIFEKAMAIRLPVAPVYTTEDLVNNPHYRMRGFWVDIEHPVAGTFTFPGAPHKFSESPWQIRTPAPLLGQHNEEVYCGLLGRSRQDLLTLRAQGAI